jgi:cold shock protein
LATGRVLQFDLTRGYGFVAADDGGEDVFLHASVFHGDPDVLVPGKKVGFQVMAGDRGRKAFDVHVVGDEPGQGGTTARPVAAPGDALHRAVPAQVGQPTEGPLASARLTAVKQDGKPQARQSPAVADDEQLCDVLSPSEFRQEFIELLLNSVPDLTGQQIILVGQQALEYAKMHGWIDG